MLSGAFQKNPMGIRGVKNELLGVSGSFQEVPEMIQNVTVMFKMVSVVPKGVQGSFRKVS